MCDEPRQAHSAGLQACVGNQRLRAPTPPAPDGSRPLLTPWHGPLTFTEPLSRQDVGTQHQYASQGAARPRFIAGRPYGWLPGLLPRSHEPQKPRARQTNLFCATETVAPTTRIIVPNGAPEVRLRWQSNTERDNRVRPCPGWPGGWRAGPGTLPTRHLRSSTSAAVVAGRWRGERAWGAGSIVIAPVPLHDPHAVPPVKELK